MTRASFVAREPVDLVAVAPHLLGFRPQDSVVLLSFSGTHSGFHARVDLPVTAEEQEQVAECLLRAVRRNGQERAAVLVYSTDVEASRSQARLLVERLADEGVGVVDVLRVESDRFYRVLEEDEIGTGYDLDAHPFSAQRVFEGHVVQPSREAVADSLVGTDEEDRCAVEAAAHERLDQDAATESCGRVTPDLIGEAAWLRRCLRHHLADGRPLTRAEAGRMLADCQRVALRDVAWGEMEQGNAPAQVVVWRDLVRRAPDRLLPPAAALLGFAAWLAGDGALSWCALDRCLAQDPDYSMAHLVAGLLEGAVPPRTWEQVDEEDRSRRHFGSADEAG